MLKVIKCLLLIFLPVLTFCQFEKNDSIMLRNIYNEALTDKTGYHNLEYLVTKIGGRLCGSPQAAAAVEWAKQEMEHLGFDTVYLQELKVKNWKRGNPEKGTIVSSHFGNFNVNICGLGGSVSTPENGISANVVEVTSFDELEKIGRKGIEGKIVFFNQPMTKTHFYTFQGYGDAAYQRVSGAAKAAEFGAVAAVVRSLTIADDEFPHTGSMHYSEKFEKIPAVAICTRHADILSNWLKEDKNLFFYLKTNGCSFPESVSYNVVGEIKGSEFPDEIIMVCGHLDSWDIDPGAHDDGTGCIQAMEVLRIFKKLHIKPKHTIRAVMFMDEEMAQRGAAKYSEIAKQKKEKHLAAIESDRGGLMPVALSIVTSDEKYSYLEKWEKYFELYGLKGFVKMGDGVDIGPLREQGVPLVALVTESQRYFEYHHCANDTFDKVNIREMQLGSAAITFFVFLIDKYGW